jgi:hypothetical protein
VLSVVKRSTQCSAPGSLGACGGAAGRRKEGGVKYELEMRPPLRESHRTRQGSRQCLFAQETATGV